MPNIRAAAAAAMLALACAACGGSLPTRPDPVSTTTTTQAPPEPQSNPLPAPTPPDPGPPPTPAPVQTARLSVTRFLAFGDSFTEGIIALLPRVLALSTPQSYPTKLAAMFAARYPEQAVTVVNEGYGGEQAADALPRLHRALSQHGPQVLLLMDGVNDLNAGNSRQATVDAMEELIKAAVYRGVDVLVATLPPQRPGGFRAHSHDRIVPFNEQLKRMAVDKGATVVDVHAAFGSDDSLIGPDGLHPSESGYVRIAETFLATIRTEYEQRVSLTRR
jgi:lysophospholipase L1-like esterase